jgi:hypothetical protein
MAVVTSSEVINTGYAMLALVADALVLLAVLGFLLSRASPAARERWTRFRDGVSPFAVHIAWITAMLATFGSLFLQYAEHVPNEPTVCGSAVPCNVAVINIFGFISVPFLSMAAFLLITTLLPMARSHGDDCDDDEQIDPIESTLDEEADGDAVPAPA